MNYRAIRDGEWPEAMQLWTSVFGVGSWLFQSLHDATEPRKLEHTRVAEVDGKIVSAVDIFLRNIRGLEGKPVRVGCIGSVATYEEYRKQGHSGHLLTDAIRIMEEEGCQWSFLFTGTHHHYRRYGWADLPLPVRTGTISTLAARTPGYQVEQISGDGPYPLRAMASLYGEFNRSRPLSHDRSALNWSTATAARLARSERKTFVVTRGEIIAYGVAEFQEDGAVWHEFASKPNDIHAAEPIAEAIRSEMISRGLSKLTVRLPDQPDLNGVLAGLSPNLEKSTEGWSMARPIAPGVTMEDLQRLPSAPGARWWDLDAF